MSKVQTPAGVAGELAVRRMVRTADVTYSTLSRSSPTTRFWLAGRTAALVALVATLLFTVALPVGAQDADEGGYTYADMGYQDPAKAATALAQSSSSGQGIADFALQFQGYPYVWAGNGPGGFDCSGFTQYVLLNVLGTDIGHGVAEQTAYGSWVDWGAWQPGDLVYFAGTYRAGISHAGVYIGDGQFIHAENAGTGVVISSIYSDYYAGHYYGAYRHV
jgi:cell wall-associated NlpC family hydrolase